MASIARRLREHIENPHCATSMGDPRQTYPPATLATVEAAETRLGFRLPDLLREMYTQVGNGGFGPGYGIFGLTDGAPACDGGGNSYDLIEYYRLYRGQQEIPELEHDFAVSGSLFLESLDQWFDKLLPICDWGCNHYSLLDCSKQDAPVIHFIGYGGELLLEYPVFAEWIEAWIDGVDLWALATGTSLTGEALSETLGQSIWRRRLQRLEPEKILEDELRQLVRQGKIISAITKYQGKTHCSLEEAREHIDSIVW